MLTMFCRKTSTRDFGLGERIKLKRILKNSVVGYGIHSSV